MMTESVLIVDDEDSIRTLVTVNLERSGYKVLQAANGSEAIEKLNSKPDLILLDIMLPDIDGFELCKVLRQTTSVPIIFLTARDDEVDKIVGLELGADDYITKPFSPREMVARVRAVLRRAKENVDASNNHSASQDDILRYGDLELNLIRHQVTRAGKVLDLTPKEFELLEYLMRNANIALSRDQLLDAVWRADYFGDNRIVDVHIRHLREKIEDNSGKPRFIITVRGVGYRFETP